MTAALKLFVEEARGVSIADAALRLDLKFKRGSSARSRGYGGSAEHPQPCPACGGTDTFSFNVSKNKWVCRKGGAGGGDAIGMAAHVLGLDINRREGFLAACEAVLGKQIPEGGERESNEDRAAREKRLADQRRRNEEEAANRDADAADFREREREKARGIVRAAQAVPLSALPHGRFYLMERCGGFPPGDWLRVSPSVTYWHGQDDRGHPIDLHSGPAMVAPFVASDMSVIGCHITWIDLAVPPKLRPRLVDPGTGEILPSKKMRGSKKGGLIPIAGDPSARRWVGGEGIENGVAFGGWEGWRADTFYFAAGDLGNLSGPADPASRFAHPTLTMTDKRSRTRPIMVAGPVPAPDSAGEAMWVSDHVNELVLLADKDSERIMTTSAMQRARKRFTRGGRLLLVVWPLFSGDFAERAVAAK